MRQELETCPKCGGHADNGFSREIPPSPYYCRACMAEDRIEELEAERDKLKAEIAELVAALEPFSGIDLVESRLPAEFAMLVLRARAAIAKVRKP